MISHCKACNDRINTEDPQRKDWPKSERYSPGDYCRACYFELVTGAIPNVVHTAATGKAGLTARQSAKLGMVT